jgi:hypothetical protein
MDEVKIIKVEVSEGNNLLVTPTPDKDKSKNLYQYIYRMATGVYWDEEKQSFSSPSPREWSYFQWFENIVHCAKSELGVTLVITPETHWSNVPNNEKEQMESHASTNT